MTDGNLQPIDGRATADDFARRIDRTNEALANLKRKVVVQVDGGDVGEAVRKLEMELNSLSMAIFVTYNESDGEAKGSTNLDEMERKAIVDALKKTRGNVSQAARELGKPRMALRYRIEKHGIDINEFRQSSE